MQPLTANLLVKCGASAKFAPQYVEPLNRYLTQYHVTTFLRLCHFLSQILHESIALTATVEDLDYSAVRLMKMWPKRFATLEFAKQYARQPQKIANYVYANRLGNGSTQSNEGWLYRGRGPMQNTGKDKYILQKKRTGIDYVLHPEYLERPDDGMRAAFDFWRDNNLNALADLNDVKRVTEGVNGGLNGLDERTILLTRCKKALAPLFAQEKNNVV